MTPIDKLRYLAAQICILAIRIYQRFISRYLPPRCRFYPSCSRYAAEAIRKHGAVKGIVMGTWRILRCNPFSRGGVDYVPDRFELPRVIVFSKSGK